ncbi:MAG TPA: ribonuclease P protein component [Ignavibacteria bacterium]|nr:ribonuclease P protein component [Ignavibacteria bacterium]
MKKSERSSGKRSLKRSNIIRGFNIFSNILNNSKVIQTGFIKAYVQTQNKEPLNKNLFSPLVTDNVKVGFIIAKKYIRKSYFRNRIKRLLRESYRKNKIGSEDLDVKIIYSLSQNGYNYFKKFPMTKNIYTDNEIKKVNLEIKAYLGKLLI